MSERYPSLRFMPGRLLATPGAVELLEANGVEVMALIGLLVTLTIVGVIYLGHILWMIDRPDLDWYLRE